MTLSECPDCGSEQIGEKRRGMNLQLISRRWCTDCGRSL